MLLVGDKQQIPPVVVRGSQLADFLVSLGVDVTEVDLDEDEDEDDDAARDDDALIDEEAVESDDDEALSLTPMEE